MSYIFIAMTAVETSLLLSSVSQPLEAVTKYYQKWRDEHYYTIIIDSDKNSEAFQWTLDFIANIL